MLHGDRERKWILNSKDMDFMWAELRNQVVQICSVHFFALLMIYTFVNIHPIISYPCIQLRMVYGLVFKFITFYKQCYLSILQYLRCINQEICWATCILASNGSPQYGKVVEYLYRYHYFDSLKYTLYFKYYGQISWDILIG